MSVSFFLGIGVSKYDNIEGEKRKKKCPFDPVCITVDIIEPYDIPKYVVSLLR